MADYLGDGDLVCAECAGVVMNALALDGKVRGEFFLSINRLEKAGISRSINKIFTNYPEIYRKGSASFDELDRIWVKGRSGEVSLQTVLAGVENAERVWREVLTDFKFLTGMSL